MIYNLVPTKIHPIDSVRISVIHHSRNFNVPYVLSRGDQQSDEADHG